MVDSTAKQLLELLNRKREAIIQADFLAVDHCVAKKETLLTALNIHLSLQNPNVVM